MTLPFSVATRASTPALKDIAVSSTQPEPLVLTRLALPQHYGDYSIGSGYKLTQQVLARRQRPTALVCGNDRMAIGSLLAVQALGLECPGDVSIVGFDDQPDVADQVRPGLTTVALPHLEMGRRAGGLLLDEPSEPIDRVTVPAELITRESLGPPPARRRRLRHAAALKS